MERGEVQYSRARRSFEKANGEGRAPPARLQVIGFNVSPKAEGGLEIVSSAKDELSFDTKTTSPSPLPKPASSPRSALQQLLLHQSLPSTSSPFSNHSLPPLLPPSTTSSSSATHAATSSNHNFTRGLLQLAPSPPAATHKSTIAHQLLQPAYISPPPANQNCTSGFSKFQSPPASAYQTHSSSELLKSLRHASSDVPANQSSRTSFFSSLGQSQCASSSSSSSGNQSMRGSGVSVNMQVINQHNSKPSKALIKESYEAFFQINQVGDDKIKEFNNGSDAKAHEISAKEVINGLPFVVAKSQRSSWLHDDIDQYPSAEKCKKSSWKGVQQIHEHPLGNEKSRKSSWNEEKGKKSSLFIFMGSSPAVEFHHHHHHHAEYFTSKNMDFLSSCHLCRRLLGPGQDVFMYSGDKAFCSMECRYQQIVMDERKERCPPPIIRSGASQVYQHSSVTATTTSSHHPIMINNPRFINTAAAA